MKKLLLCLAFLSAIGQMIAQTSFNKAYHDINEKPDPFLVNINGDLYFTTGSYDVQHFGQTNLYKHDAAGNLVFKLPVPGFYASHGFRSFDDKLVIVSREIMCDVVDSTQNIYLTKLNTNGSSIFTSTFVVNTYDNPKAALQHSDSSYFIFTDSVLFKFSKTGQFISRTNFGFEGISSAMLLSNNNILISANQSAIKLLAEISPAGVVVTSNTLPVLLSKLSYYGGQKIMGLGTDGKLYKFSVARNLISSSAFSGGLPVADFVISADTVYAVLSSASAGANYAVTDTAFNSISITTTTTHSFSQNALCLNSNNIAILGTGLASLNSWGGPSYHYFTSLSVINKFSNNNFTNDLALVSIIPDSTYVSCVFSNFPSPGEFHCSTFLRPGVKIKNIGASIISEFKLNCFDSPSMGCGAYYYQEKFSGLALQPGDSLTFTATRFARKVYSYSGVASSFTAQYCFYITLPNGEADKVFEDNETCSSLVFIITSLKEHLKNDLSIKVSPNPFENSITVESETAIKTIEVINTLGMTISKNVVNDTKAIFSDPELPAGLYFVMIETEKGSITKKIIKQ